MIADALKWGESLIIEEKLRKKFNTHNSYHLFNPQVGKIPWRREWLPTPVFWPGEFLELYSPWGHKELDTTEQLSLPLSLSSFCISRTV